VLASFLTTTQALVARSREFGGMTSSKHGSSPFTWYALKEVQILPARLVDSKNMALPDR